jgi:2-methylisocitrate lyase-like PEP mutase family enzyme
LAIDPAVRHKRLRELIRTGPPLLLPGVVDAIWARLCETRGFDAVYVTGAGVSNSYLSLADVGLLSFPEILDRVERITEAVQVPVVVDADTGYGGLNFVGRAVSLFEARGVSGIQIEDQSIPKRCGHFDGRKLAPVSEMQARIDAAVSARRDPNLVIIARTDAVGIDGFDAAVERAHRYREAGADVIFIESPHDEEQIAAIPALFPDTPTLFNVVPAASGRRCRTRRWGSTATAWSCTPTICCAARCWPGLKPWNGCATRPRCPMWTVCSRGRTGRNWCAYPNWTRSKTACGPDGERTSRGNTRTARSCLISAVRSRWSRARAWVWDAR